LVGETGKKIFFLVDNQASLKVLAGTNVKFDSVKTTRDVLHSLGFYKQCGAAVDQGAYWARWQGGCLELCAFHYLISFSAAPAQLAIGIS
jgi:hypothetical protein